ncbi:MAG TPA: hypothetical protein VF473_04840 [Cyclobacteriaceae bacterium]
MKRIFIVILFLSVAAESYSQRRTDFNAAYIFGKLGGFNGTQDMGGTFLAGYNLYNKLSKKEYTVSSTHSVIGLRFSRSGYKMKGYDPYPGKSFFDKYSVSHIESSLTQYMVTVPIGIDFQFKSHPVTTPKSSNSIKITLNNSFMVNSMLKESVSYDNVKKTNMTSYASKYIPGISIEARVEFFLVGLTWQRVAYKIPTDALNIDASTGSPFYELFSKKGKYNDFYVYLGLVINGKKASEEKNK